PPRPYDPSLQRRAGVARGGRGGKPPRPRTVGTTSGASALGYAPTPGLWHRPTIRRNGGRGGKPPRPRLVGTASGASALGYATTLPCLRIVAAFAAPHRGARCAERPKRRRRARGPRTAR